VFVFGGRRHVVYSVFLTIDCGRMKRWPSIRILEGGSLRRYSRSWLEVVRSIGRRENQRAAMQKMGDKKTLKILERDRRDADNNKEREGIHKYNYTH